MLSLLFGIWVLLVAGKVAVFALRAGWGIIKFGFTVVFLPMMLIGMLIGGLIHLAVPILVLIGIITLVKEISQGGAF